MPDTSLEGRPTQAHKQWVKSRTHHLHEMFFIVLFDPLGSNVNLPDPVPFSFNVSNLIEFLGLEHFDPLPTGFYGKVATKNSLQRRDTLVPVAEEN